MRNLFPMPGLPTQCLAVGPSEPILPPVFVRGWVFDSAKLLEQANKWGIEPRYYKWGPAVNFMCTFSALYEKVIVNDCLRERRPERN